MKKVRKKIDYNETGIYRVIQVSERYFNKFFDEQPGPYIKALHQSACQVCNVYTNQETVLNAFLKLNGTHATNQVFLDHENRYLPIEYYSYLKNEIQYEDRFNCHGFTFLNAQFWFELDNETVDLIIAEDNYQYCKFNDLVHDGICLYYDYAGILIHSARKVNGNILSKFGINDILTIGEKDILTRYPSIDKMRTLYFNPGS